MSIEAFPAALDTLKAEPDLPGFLTDLARLEGALHQKKMADTDPARPVAAIAVNPTLALLPDGKVHACRKFPACIGNIKNRSLYDIYQSELAARYRAGSRACRACDLNAACRGCLAIAYSPGLDVFEEKDPFCFDTRAPNAG